MLHYTTVKTMMFNGINPSVDSLAAHRSGSWKYYVNTVMKTTRTVWIEESRNFLEYFFMVFIWIFEKSITFALAFEMLLIKDLNAEIAQLVSTTLPRSGSQFESRFPLILNKEHQEIGSHGPRWRNWWTHVSGACVVKTMQVRVLFWAQSLFWM